MKGDFDSSDLPEADATAVQQQQGRILLDRDLNVYPQLAPDETWAAAADPKLTMAVAQVSQMTAAVDSGDLVLDEDTVAKVRRAVSDLVGRVDTLIADAATLEQPLKLGNNWVAGVMSRHLRSAASGREGAAVPVLQKFRDAMHDYEEALAKAVAHGQESDELAADDMKGLLNEADDDREPRLQEASRERMLPDSESDGGDRT